VLERLREHVWGDVGRRHGWGALRKRQEQP